MKVQPKLYKVSVSSSYGYGKTLEEDYIKFQQKFVGIGEDLFTFKSWDSEYEYSQNCVEENDVIVDDKQLVTLAVRGIEFKVIQEIKVEIDISQQLHELASKPIAISLTGGGDTNYNTRCDVHIPNVSMLMYNDLKLLEDICTDELQSALNSGWRIIAACPQPDQRRPDYILGRFNPDIEVGGSAER